MACSHENYKLMHEYLDGNMPLTEAKKFEAHVQECPECERHLQELKKTVAIVQSASHFEAPEGLTKEVMNQLPKQNQPQKWQNWLRRHPFLITAAAFFLVFLLSLSAGFGGEEEIMVKGDGHFIVDESRKVVIIPEGSTIQGDLLIRNGNVEVNGEIEGDITVIHGEHLQASTARIAGDIEEINDTMEWLWYEIKEFAREVLPFSSNEKEDE
jgi:anti-sigma factor RsiW